LMMHGGPGFDHTYFRPHFDRMGGRCRVVYYDLRSSGRSGRPPIESFTMEQAADDSAALLDHLGIDRAVVCGHSYGGFIAQELALRHPDRLAGLVLVDTTPGQLGDTDDPLADQGPPPPAEFLEAISSFPGSDDEYAALAPSMLAFYLHQLTWQDVAPLFADTIFSVDALTRGMQVLSDWSSVDRLDQIVAPCLVLAGRYDIPTSWQQSARIARRIPHAELVVLEESGHFPWIEEPEPFVDVLRGWLARVQQA
ncbi:MAG: alpha/beta fold hydrolase, partial [Acidimicrobiales bacterium]